MFKWNKTFVAASGLGIVALIGAPAVQASSNGTTQVCVFDVSSTSYSLRAVTADIYKGSLGALPRAQNFAWGQDYLPDNNTLCASAVTSPSGSVIVTVPTKTP